MSCWHTALGAKFAWSNPLVVDWVMVCSKDVQGLTQMRAQELCFSITMLACSPLQS